MPNWKEVLEEVGRVNRQGNQALDVVRRKYLKSIFQYTKRNVIAYYSGWLQRPNSPDVIVNDKDISGFMLNIHKMDRKRGLDLILHTPGGSLVAAEALVTYLKSMFGKDIRAIVPQLSMSAGTMIAFSCKEIVLGKHSSLGPIDPQMGNMPCQAVLAEFERARNEIKNDPKNAALWQFIISKYHPTFLSSCQHAIDMSVQLVEDWLNDNMFENESDKTSKVIEHFSSHDNSKTHARHISLTTCKEMGLNIFELESDDKLQDLVLTTHHAFMHTFANSGALKIIENQNGVAYIEHLPINTSN